MQDEDDLAESYLIPTEQEAIPFHDRTIIAVRLTDGRIAVIIRWLCEGFGLDAPSQMRRIKRDEDGIADDLVFVQIETEARGQRVMAALILRSVQVWLAGINPNLVSEDMRPAIRALRREAVEVLREHFERKRQQLTAATAVVPMERPPFDADPFVVADYLERLATLIRRQAVTEQQVREVATQLHAHAEQIADLSEQVGELHARMEEHEEVARVLAEATARLGPETLTPEHQATVQAMAGRLNKLAAIPHAAIYNDLRQSFHVGTYKQIPEGRWSEVTAWFKQRIDAAQKKRAI